MKPETDEHELLSVAAVDGRCQLQHRSFKQKELVGKACVNKHTFQNQSFQNLMHFDVFDVKKQHRNKMQVNFSLSRAKDG